MSRKLAKGRTTAKKSSKRKPARKVAAPAAKKQGTTIGRATSAASNYEEYPITPSPKPARESPAPEPLLCGLNDPSHPDASNEPVLNIDNIQGNILNGFMKDNQAFLFLTLAP